MPKHIKLKSLILLIVYIVVGLLLLVFLPTNLDRLLFNNYIFNIFSYVIMGILFIYISNKNSLDIFDPFLFISFIYITMFTIVPNYDIAMGETLWFGTFLFDYGIKGSVIALIGYFSICLGYTLQFKQRKNITKSNDEKSVYNRNIVVVASLILWLFCLGSSLSYLVLTGGMNLSYIFTLGLIGDANTLTSVTSSLGILSMFSYSLIPLSLIYNIYGKSKLIKTILFTATLMIQLIRGFRFIIIIFILAFGIIHYLRKGKRPSKKVLAVTFSVIVIFNGIIGFYREDIRNGQEVQWEELSPTDFTEAILGNFRIYHSYYAVVKAVPESVPHTLGEQMIEYTIVMMIPRAIWDNKPSPPGMKAIEIGISKYAVQAGTAYPFIGEFYYEFGITGVIVFSILFGVLFRKIKDKYLNNAKDDFDLLVFAIMVPTILQLMIRGYTPSNFYLVLFLIVPIIVLKFISKKRLR